jgi:hypothetical protein
MITNLFSAKKTTGTSSAINAPFRDLRVVQATLADTTTPEATVVVEGSADGVGWVTLATLTLSGALASEGFVLAAPWPQIRARVTAISGANAAVTVTAAWVGV